MTARECHNQKDCQKVLQSNGLPGSTTIKRNAREYHYQKDCQGVPHSKGLSGSITIKRTDRESTYKITTRECHNQKDYQKV